MTLSQWIDKREMSGMTTFSYKEAEEKFPNLSSQVFRNELYLQCKAKRIQSVMKGFYTIVPMQFRDRGIVPPYNYIGQLMKYLGKPYYISLLSAGVLLGAAHQRPQRLMVTTEKPFINIGNSEIQIVWNYRPSVPLEMLNTTNSDTGPILYSNSELTAVDLVQYNHLIGGLSVASTVLSELIEKIDFAQFKTRLADITSVPTLLRLGYILENILESPEQADIIYYIIGKDKIERTRYVPLATSKPVTDSMERDKRWKLIVNDNIDPDDIW